MKKLNLLPLLFLGTLTIPSIILAENVSLSATAEVMSNYIYRGMSQSDDKASAKVGVNAYYNGFYAGGTAQTVDFGSDDEFELDYYAGYTNSLGKVTYDLNYFVTNYDGSTDSSEEVALGLSAEVLEGLTLGATYAKGIDKAPDNLNVKASYDVNVAVLNLDYNDYDTLGKATTFGISKAFDVSKYKLNTALNYTSFSTENTFVEEQDNLYLVLGLAF